MSVSEFLRIEIFWDFLSVRQRRFAPRIFHPSGLELTENPRRTHGEPTENPGMVHVGPRIGGAVVGGGQRRWSPWILGLTLDILGLTCAVSICFNMFYGETYQEISRIYKLLLTHRTHCTAFSSEPWTLALNFQMAEHPRCFYQCTLFWLLGRKNWLWPWEARMTVSRTREKF